VLLGRKPARLRLVRGLQCVLETAAKATAVEIGREVEHSVRREHAGSDALPLRFLGECSARHLVEPDAHALPVLLGRGERGHLPRRTSSLGIAQVVKRRGPKRAPTRAPAPHCQTIKRFPSKGVEVDDQGGHGINVRPRQLRTRMGLLPTLADRCNAEREVSIRLEWGKPSQLPPFPCTRRAHRSQPRFYPLSGAHFRASTQRLGRRGTCIVKRPGPRSSKGGWRLTYFGGRVVRSGMSRVTGRALSKRPDVTSPWGDRRPWHTGQLLRRRLLLAL